MIHDKKLKNMNKCIIHRKDNDSYYKKSERKDTFVLNL